MNFNEKKTLEARERRLERSKFKREFLCSFVDEIEPELDDSTKNYLKNKINSLEIRDEKSIISGIEEFKTEQKFLDLYDGEEIINSSQKELLKRKIRNNEITDKETLKNEIQRLIRKEKIENARKIILLNIIDEIYDKLILYIGIEGYEDIKAKINDKKITNKKTLLEEIEQKRIEKTYKRTPIKRYSRHTYRNSSML